MLVIPDGVDIPTFLLSDGKIDLRPSLPKILTLHELLENYFGSIPKGSLEAITLHGMKVHQGHLERGLGKAFLIQGLEAAHLQKYIEERSTAAGFRGRDISGATIKKEVVTLRTIWNWSLHMGFVTKPFPNRGLRYPKLHEKPPFQTLAEIEARIERGGLTKAEEGDLWDSAFLSLEEVSQLIDDVAARPVHTYAPPMFVFAAHTGARKSEILRAKVDDLDFHSGTILIREKKRVKGKLSTRRVPMTPRLSAAVSMKVEDFYAEGKRWWLRLHEKGGKRHEVPAHHNADEYLDAYLKAADIAAEKRTPLFRTIDRSGRITARGLTRNDALRMIKRRAKAAGLSEKVSCHTFRATGITAYLENDGTIENDQSYNLLWMGCTGLGIRRC